MKWQQFWQKKGLVNFALLPLSAVFYLIIFLRRRLYQYNLLSAKKSPLPVVVVGNINVGGTGKTPLVIALGQWLAENDIVYAVISKGYGGSYQGLAVVSEDDSADVVGDEPLLIKLKCACPVIVAKSRFKAAQYIAKHFPSVQVLLTDDGLQHYPLQRNIEICVINDKVGLGNGWVLPAGGLREPPSRLNSVDFTVHNLTTGTVANQAYHYFLADRGWYQIHTGKKRFHDEFSAEESQNLALSGIAHPQFFFQCLDTFGIKAQKRPLPDHYAFQARDLPADKTLLMTEKDWVKVKAYPHKDAWYLAVEAVLSPSLKRDFLIQVKSLL